MKYYSVLMALAASALAFELPNDPDFEANALACSTEHGFDMSVFEKSAEAHDLKIFEKHNSRCFLRCMLIKSDILKKDVLDFDLIKTKYNLPDDVIEKSKECSAKNTQEDPCDRVYEIEMCVMEHMKPT